MNVYAKFHCAALHIKKALGNFRELIPRTRRRRRTRVASLASLDPPSASKNKNVQPTIQHIELLALHTHNTFNIHFSDFNCVSWLSFKRSWTDFYRPDVGTSLIHDFTAVTFSTKLDVLRDKLVLTRKPQFAIIFYLLLVINSTIYLLPHCSCIVHESCHGLSP